MFSSQHSQAIIVVSGYETAVLVLDQLIVAGFSPLNISIVSNGGISDRWSETTIQNARAHQIPMQVIIESSTGFRVGWFFGSVVGGAIGLLVGLKVSALPSVDGAMLVFRIAFTLASGFFCTVSGGIIGALIGLRVADKQVKESSQQIVPDKFLIAIGGTKDEIARAKHLLDHLSLN